MLTVTHAVIGATSGRFIEKLSVVFLLNIIIHFPLDKVPHFLPEKKKQIYTLATVDTLLTVGFLTLLFFYKGEFKNSMIAGALGGVFIDFVLILTPLLKTKIGEWHVNRQSHRANRANLIIDFLFLSLLLAFWWVIK